MSEIKAPEWVFLGSGFARVRNSTGPEEPFTITETPEPGLRVFLKFQKCSSTQSVVGWYENSFCHKSPTILKHIECRSSLLH